MAFTERIAVIIDAVKDGAVRGLGATGVAAEGVAVKTRGANLMLRALNTTGLASTAMGKRLTAGANETGTALGGMRAAGIGLGSVLKVGVAGGAVAAAAGIAAFAVKGAKDFIALTSEVRAFQRVSGETAQDSSKMVAASKMLGMSTETTARGVAMLAKNLGTGKLKLSDYGVEVKRTSQGHLDMAATVANVSAHYQSLGSIEEKAAFAQAAYGKSWAQMTPFLSKGKEELQQIYAQAAKRGLIFNQSDLDQGRELSVKMRELDEAGKGLGITLGKEVVPALADGATVATEFLDSIQPVLHTVGQFPGALKRIGFGLHDLLAPWEDSKLAALDQVQAYDKAANANKDFAEGMLAQVQATNNAKVGLQGLTAETENYVGVALSAEAANRSVIDAIDNVTKAQKDASDAGGHNAEANKRVDDSLFSLKQSINQAAEANKAAAIAQAAGTSEAHQAAVGQQAYADTLDYYAHSSSPAAALATAQLKNTVNSLGGEIDVTRYKASLPIKLFLDTAEAEGKLNSLKAKWDELTHAFGPVGPQGP